MVAPILILMIASFDPPDGRCYDLKMIMILVLMMASVLVPMMAMSWFLIVAFVRILMISLILFLIWPF
jgi:hypothetical protein